jgi:hypothetical protein
MRHSIASLPTRTLSESCALYPSDTQVCAATQVVPHRAGSQCQTRLLPVGVGVVPGRKRAACLEQCREFGVMSSLWIGRSLERVYARKSLELSYQAGRRISMNSHSRPFVSWLKTRTVVKPARS